MTENIYQNPNADLGDGNALGAPLSMQQILFSFKGRVGRKVFWLTSLGLLVGLIVLMVVMGLIGLPENLLMIVMLVVYIPVIWISLAVQAKRWHDRDKSAWWILINLVPVIGGLWALVETGFLAGTEGANRFGPSAV